MSKSQLQFLHYLYQFRYMTFCGFLVACLSAQALTLEEAIDSALKLDPALKASKFNEMATEENIAIARSRLLPQISLQGSSSQLTQTTTQDLATGGSLSRSFSGPSVNHQFVIRQALLRPKEISALKYAELQTQYMAIKYKSDTKELRFKVINAWIDLLGSQQIAQAYERPLNMMLAAANQERAKYEKGDSTNDAAIDAEAQYENAKAMYVQAIETMKSKQSAFEILTKISAASLAGEILAIDTLPVFSDTNKAVHWANFQEASLELHMARLQELMQFERLTMTEADNKPTLDLMASVNLAQNDATSTQGYQYKNKQIGIQYNIPIFSGGGYSSALKQANLSYQASLAETQAQMLRVQNEFEFNWRQVLGMAERLKAMQMSIYASEKIIESNKRSYELGVKTIADMAAAENNLSRKIVEFVLIAQEYKKIIAKLK